MKVGAVRMVGQLFGGGDDPMLESVAHLVAFAERAVVDQRGAEELGGVSGRSMVECIVRDRSGAGEHVAQDRRRGRAADTQPVQDTVRRPRGLQRSEISAERSDGSGGAGGTETVDLVSEIAGGAAGGGIKVFLGAASAAHLRADDPSARLAQARVRFAQRRTTVLLTAIAAGFAVQPPALAAAAHRFSVDATLHGGQAPAPEAWLSPAGDLGHVVRS